MHTIDTLQVIFNIFSFADGRASLIAYGVLFAVAVVISCGLVIWVILSI